MQVGLHYGTNKHKAASLLESRAKRGKLDAVEYQYQTSDLVSQSTGFGTNSLSTITSLPSIDSTEFPSLPINYLLPNSMNEAQGIGCSNVASQWPFGGWSEAVTSTDPWCTELATINPGFGIVRNLAPLDTLPLATLPLDTFHMYASTPSYQLTLPDSKPADFLAIRRTQGK